MPEVLNNTLVSEDIQNSIHYKVRQESFFLDPETHQHFLTHGWCKVTNVVTKEEIASFMDACNYICNLEGFELGNQFLNTGCLPNADIRNRTSEVINQNVKTILPRMFDMTKVASHTGGSFVIKPPHDESGLGAHQDSAFIDEEKDYSIFMWVPFCDVNEVNGAISVVSGSHLWGNTQRGFGVPWNMEKHKVLLNPYLQPVYANAGDVIFFDPALVHASAPNHSTETRPAITITVVRDKPELIYYYKDNIMPEEVVERFWVDEEFFKTYDFASKPNETIWRKDTIPYKSFDLTPEELLGLVEKYSPASVTAAV